MSDIVITGLGVVSALGTTREAFFEALADGRALGTVPGGAARIADFGVRQYIDARALRRLARLSQMALVAAKQAIAQGAPTAAPERSGIILGTGLGTMRETIDFMKGYIEGGPEQASPLLFPSSVMNAAAGQMALELGWRGVNSTVNHREFSVPGAFLLALDMLALGRADALLVGGVEEAAEPTVHGYRKLGALSPTGTMRPYSAGRDGTVLGEGAAVFLLERAEDARARGATILARIAGAASGGEDRPRVGWGRAWEGAAGVMRAAMDDAGVAPSDIGYVAGGGCGLAVDALEARAVLAATGEPRPHGSILGQTGEFMSSFALRVAAAIYALTRQALPGTAGADAPDPETPVPDLVITPRPSAPVPAVLLPSLSQGGADAALVLTRE